MTYEPILNTTIGSWLRQRRLMGIVLSCVGLCVVMLEITLPGAEYVVSTETSMKGGAIKFIMIDEKWTWVTIALHFVFFFLTAHIVCRSVAILCIQYFEPLVIASSAVAVAITWTHEFLNLFPDPSSLSNAYMFSYMLHKVCHVIFHISMSLMDAWAISTPAKACVSLLYVTAMTFWFIFFRFIREWSHKEVCVETGLCFVPNSIFFIAFANVVMFAMRLPATYCFGYEYAVLRGSYFQRRLEPRKLDIKRCFSYKNASTTTLAGDSGTLASPTTDAADEETGHRSNLSQQENKVHEKEDSCLFPERHGGGTHSSSMGFVTALMSTSDNLQAPNSAEVNMV